jgi:hypothetical protein
MDDMVVFSRKIADAIDAAANRRGNHFLPLVCGFAEVAGVFAPG